MLDIAHSSFDTSDEVRELRPAMIAGWRGKCPNCHQGQLFRSYLTVQNECVVCNEELHHQRADDGPAFITILLCGHLLAPIMHLIFVYFRPNSITLIVGFSLAFVSMALWMLPRVKGALIGLQWANRMHGFDQKDLREAQKDVSSEL